MQIRPATIEDLPALLELGRRMHQESPRFNRLSFNDEKVRNLLMMATVSPNYCMLVADNDGEMVGGFAGFIAAHWFSDDLVASDLALFVQPGRRGGLAGARLVKEFIAWAKERGPKQINLGISTGVSVEETAQLYSAIGLKQFGYLFEV
jgi:GNAT superfamily N-acetyltransferase